MKISNAKRVKLVSFTNFTIVQRLLFGQDSILNNMLWNFKIIHPRLKTKSLSLLHLNLHLSIWCLHIVKFWRHVGQWTGSVLVSFSNLAHVQFQIEYSFNYSLNKEGRKEGEREIENERKKARMGEREKKKGRKGEIER